MRIPKRDIAKKREVLINKVLPGEVVDHDAPIIIEFYLQALLHSGCAQLEVLYTLNERVAHSLDDHEEGVNHG
jgi:hypothetical protein